MVALLIYRAEEFSPNNVAKDAAILEAVGDCLLHKGWEVCYRHEEVLQSADVQRADRIYSMARRQHSLQLLAAAQCPVCNPVEGTQLCVGSRTATYQRLQRAGVNVPPPGVPGWVKGMHPKGVQKGDVAYLTTQAEVDARIAELRAEGYTDILVSRHQSGALLKVYVVGPRYWYFWPGEEAYTKFGDETATREPARLQFEESELSHLAATIAQALHLQVFGFDAIVDSEGRLWVIDVNDWPSFSRFRAEAAEAVCDPTL